MANDLWKETLRHLDEGNFTALEVMLGGPDGFDAQMIDWHKAGKFAGQPEALAEAFTCACMLGRVTAAEYLLDNNVDPLAGTKTGLNGFHYAASSGKLDVVKLLIERGVPLEIENMYGGTVFGQALWSAVFEHKASHADIIAELVAAGAVIEPGTFEWWEKQDVPSEEAKLLIAETLRKAQAP